MIWFFLAGFIAGAVGAVMIILWWFKTHMTRISAKEMMQILELEQDEIIKSEGNDL